MNSKTYDLAVAYRVYPNVSKTPPAFKDDKYKLADLCLKSFKESLGSLKVKMLVILDNCPTEYEDLFTQYFDQHDLVFYREPGIGNRATFDLQLHLLLEQPYSEVVYFAEDDYIYQPNQFREMVEFLTKNEYVDFITPYDHLDYYTWDLHKGRYEITFFGGKHWRTAGSTCLTFMTTKNTLRKTKNCFSTYARGNADCSLWLSLTKYKIGNPLAIISLSVNSKDILQVFFLGWKYCWNQIVLGRTWKLWVPMPTIATHMESSFLAPTMGEAYFQRTLHQ